MHVFSALLLGTFPMHRGMMHVTLSPVLKEWGPQGHGLVCIQVHLKGVILSANLSISQVFITQVNK